MKIDFSHLNLNRFIRVERWPSQALVLPRLQTHRGYWQGGIQENTLQAFREARRLGSLMFECDVRLSKDKIPVVFHDENLSRLASRNELVSDLNADELNKIANIPTLWEVLRDAEVPRLVNIELKTKQKLDDPLERKVAEVIKTARAQNRILFSSFNPMSLFRMSLHLPQVPRALLVTDENDPDNSFLLKKMVIAPFLNFHILHLHHSMLTEESMELWKKNRVPIAVWTVDGKEEIEKYLKLGCVSVISNKIPQR